MMLFLCTGCGKEKVQIEQKATSETIQEQATKKKESICVYICGAVTNPGVYKLDEGKRICDGIAAAGGVLEDAAAEELNQAEYLTDGQMIHVPTKEEAKQKEDAQGSREDGRININHADIEELMTLPGIGESKAEAIISYREEHGNYQSTEDIMNISGIKEKVYSKIKESITVN